MSLNSLEDLRKQRGQQKQQVKLSLLLADGQNWVLTSGDYDVQVPGSPFSK